MTIFNESALTLTLARLLVDEHVLVLVGSDESRSVEGVQQQQLVTLRPTTEQRARL